MVFVEREKVSYNFHDRLSQLCDKFSEHVHRDNDAVVVVTGMERSGKSTLAQQMATYVDPTFCLDRVCLNAIEFREKVIKAKKFQAFIFDEASLGLSSRSTMSKLNKMIVNCMQIIGQKNLFIFVVLPSFFDLDKYVAIDRSLVLIHTYTKNGRKGMFQVYSNGTKKYLYIKGKAKREMGAVRPQWNGRFNKTYTVDGAAYRKKKEIYLDRNWGELIGDKKAGVTGPQNKAKKRLLATVLSLKEQGFKTDQIAMAVSRFDNKVLSNSTIKSLIKEAKDIFMYHPDIKASKTPLNLGISRV